MGEDPLEEGMATHSSVLAWRIPWTEDPGRFQSMGLQKSEQLSDSVCMHQGPYCQHSFITVDAELDHLAEAAFARSLCRKGTLSSFPSCSLREEITMWSALKEWKVTFLLWELHTTFYCSPFCSRWRSRKWELPTWGWLCFSPAFHEDKGSPHWSYWHSGEDISLWYHLPHLVGFPGVSDGKASACNLGDPGSIPGSGRSSGKGNGNPLQYSGLENSMDGGAW